MGRKFKFAVFRFYWIWWELLLISILGTGVISFFSEVPEVFTWGYELGFFLYPVFSSLLISIPIYFFTSHLSESSRLYNEYLNFEEFIFHIRNLMTEVHKDSGVKSECPTFYENNLDQIYLVSFSESYFLNRRVVFLGEELFLRQKITRLYAMFYLMKNSGAPDKGILDSEYNRLFHLVIHSTEAFQKDGDIKSFFKNLISTLSQANFLFHKDRKYQLFYKIRQNRTFPDLKFQDKVFYQV
jgi:hypothetical protein